MAERLAKERELQLREQSKAAHYLTVCPTLAGELFLEIDALRAELAESQRLLEHAQFWESAHKLEKDNLKAELAASEQARKEIELTIQISSRPMVIIQQQLAERDSRIAELEKRQIWRCFHCDFATSDRKEALGHFGDRDEENPICIVWQSLNADGRVQEYQSALRELEAEREENSRYRTQVEALELRVEGQLYEIKSFKPFRECRSIQEIFHVYDSMEGCALLAEEQKAQLQTDVERLTEVLQECNLILHPKTDDEVKKVVKEALSTPSAQQAQERIAAMKDVMEIAGDLAQRLLRFEGHVTTCVVAGRLDEALQRWKGLK